MSQYDREMLEEYMTIQETIQNDEQSIVDERVALSALQEQALAKQDEVSGMVNEASLNVADYQDQISKKEAEVLEMDINRLLQGHDDIAVSTLLKILKERTSR